MEWRPLCANRSAESDSDCPNRCAESDVVSAEDSATVSEELEKLHRKLDGGLTMGNMRTSYFGFFCVACMDNQGITYFDILDEEKRDNPAVVKWSFQEVFRRRYALGKRKYYIWSDCCVTHFRQRQSLHALLVEAVNEFATEGLLVESISWNFFCPCHGKCVCDGRFATVKSTLREFAAQQGFGGFQAVVEQVRRVDCQHVTLVVPPHLPPTTDVEPIPNISHYLSFERDLKERLAILCKPFSNSAAADSRRIVMTVRLPRSSLAAEPAASAAELQPLGNDTKDDPTGFSSENVSFEGQVGQVPLVESSLLENVDLSCTQADVEDVSLMQQRSWESGMSQTESKSIAPTSDKPNSQQRSSQNTEKTPCNAHRAAKIFNQLPRRAKVEQQKLYRCHQGTRNWDEEQRRKVNRNLAPKSAVEGSNHPMSIAAPPSINTCTTARCPFRAA